MSLQDRSAKGLAMRTTCATNDPHETSVARNDVPYSKPVSLALLALLGCAKTVPQAIGLKAMAATARLDVEAAPTTQGKRVLVVANQNDPDSIRLASYYANKRGVPKDNIVLVQTVTTERIPLARYEKEIHDPIRAALAKTKNPIDFILMMRGLPLRNAEAFGNAIDSLLMADGLPTQKLTVGPNTFELAPNPYYGKSESFSHAKFGIYLVCRLDGYTPEEARALVDRSLAAKPNKGPFLLVKGRGREAEGYGEVQATLDRAAIALKDKRLGTTLAAPGSFPGSAEPLAGYATWGSNDPEFKPDVYRALRFLPGAVVETFVSTSARSLRKPVPAGQSAIGDLIAQGVTGVKGYIGEPYVLAMARADILFDRYTAGYNLAESFYAASPVTHWKDVVIGDPLCAPYKK